MIQSVPKMPQNITAQNLFGLGAFYNPMTWLKFIATNLFGQGVSLSVLPAQALKHDEDFFRSTCEIETSYRLKISKLDDVTQNTFMTIAYDGSQLETMELLNHAEGKKLSHERNYIIYVPGNGMLYQDSLREMLEDCQEMKWNIVGFNYRNVFRSTGLLKDQMGLITDVITQIERLKQEGVRSDHIHLLGHSTGAGIATLVSYVYSLHSEAIKLFNGRSFTSYSEFKYHQLGSDNEKRFKGPFIRAKYLLTNFEIPALHYYKLIQNHLKDYISVKQSKTLEGTVKDGVIPDEALLHTGLKTERKQIKQQLKLDGDIEALVHMEDSKVLSFSSMMGCGHNEPVRTLECSNSRTSARERYRTFFKA